MMPPPDLDDPSEFPEEQIFRDVLAPWSKGAITYKTWFDEPLDSAFTLANNILEDQENRRKEMAKPKKR